MALNSNKYKLLLEAQVDPKSVQSQLSNLKSKIQLGFEYNKNDLDKLYAKLEQLNAEGNKISKIRLFEDGSGGISKAVINYTDQLGNMSVATEKIRDGLTVTNRRTIDLRSGFDNLTKSMISSIATTARYALSIGMLYNALDQLKQGINYIADLNKEMVKIQLLQVPGASSDKELASLATTYNKLAKELGATTLEVSKGSVEWLRQGKSIGETQQLLKATMELSKLGALDSADATEKLTATLNGFQLEADQAENVVSKLVSIDNIAATSVNELATAMQYSSAVANQSGVTFDQLAAMVGTVSARTRLSAEVIGQAFKTMFTRMEQVKAGEIDETGMSLNNVEKTLSAVGIALRDSADSFRPLGDVIDDVGKKWSQFTEVEKAQIANSVAGVRQAQIFLSLMQNYGDVQKYVTAQTESAGLAQNRYSIYLKSVEAAQNRAKASMEGMWQATINSDAIKFFYNLTATLFDFIAKLGGLQTVLGAVIVALGVFNAESLITTANLIAMNALSVLSFFRLFALQVQNGTAAMWLLNAALDVNPIVLLVSAVGLAVGAFAIFNKSIADLTRNAEELQEKLEQTASKIKNMGDEKKQLTDLYKTYEELRKKVDDSSDSQQEWFDVQNKIKEILPAVSGYYDEQGNFILKNVDSLQQLIDLKNEEIDLEKRKLALNAKKGYGEEIKLYKKLSEDRKFYVDFLNDAEKANADKNSKMYKDTLIKLEDANIKLVESEIRLREFYSSLTESDQKLFLEAVKGTEIYNLLTKAITESTEAAKNSPTGGGTPFASPKDVVSDESKQALKDLQKMVVDMIKQKKKAEEDALKDQIKGIKELADAEKQHYKDILDEEKRLADEKKKNLDREYEDAKRNNSEARDAIKDQLSDYESLIDAQIDLLNEKKRAADFDKKREQNQKDLSKLESQIAVLSLDTSAEAIAQRTQLEQQAADLRDEMNQDSADEQLRLETEALNNEKESARQQADLQIKQLEEAQRIADEEHEMRLREIEDEKDAAQQQYDIQIRRIEDEYAAKEAALQAQIDQIQQYLEQEGTINNDAMSRIADKNSGVYQELIEWNKVYGSGINDDIVSSWELASDALKEYLGELDGIKATTEAIAALTPVNPYDDNINYGSNPSGGMNVMHAHHSGLDAGFVGGLKSNEQFVKALKGEIVVNPSQMNDFMSRTLPKITGAGGGGDINISMPLQVAGNLDKTVLPDIERIVNSAVKKLNESMTARGWNRRADAFGT